MRSFQDEGKDLYYYYYYYYYKILLITNKMFYTPDKMNNNIKNKI